MPSLEEQKIDRRKEFEKMGIIDKPKDDGSFKEVMEEAFLGTPETHNPHARMHELDMQFENDVPVCYDCKIVFKDNINKCPFCYGGIFWDTKDCFDKK